MRLWSITHCELVSELRGKNTAFRHRPAHRDPNCNMALRAIQSTLAGKAPKTRAAVGARLCSRCHDLDPTICRSSPSGLHAAQRPCQWLVFPQRYALPSTQLRCVSATRRSSVHQAGSFQLCRAFWTSSGCREGGLRRHFMELSSCQQQGANRCHLELGGTI